MDGSRTVWELPVSPTCLPNGPASARCLASLCCNLHSNRAGRGRNGPLSGRAPIRSRSRHRAASVASVGARSMGDSPTVWELPASATCRPNGLVSAGCWASSLSKRDSRTSFCLRRAPCRETEFRAQRQLGRKRLLAIIGRCRDSNPSGRARQFAAICQPPENLRKRETAWWSPEDSNFVSGTHSYRACLCDIANC
jgi:hypothetical protein